MEGKGLIPPIFWQLFATSRIEVVGQTLYHVLNLLAQVAPEWLKTQVGADWYEHYSQRFTNYRFPKGQAEQLALA